ncbi:sensory rhodopsin transducer [Stenotrophomonas rhizophila]|uniref:sensory rhodopsin transducer n=1 Tax=Stenotrophomonas rhizophila TaxID=216778 RepID=UPI00201CD036|nr:sensory rhodopsin transducer [Stenotrophomonas rhizophila]UQY86226.1 sensory rhodopsin transducer [Stenotrophomonas rhizophila]
MKQEEQTSIGLRCWAIAEGYIPAWSNGPEPELQSHETCCVLNAGPVDAQVTLTLYFEDREPQGPYRFTVPARRTCHKRFNDLESPATVPRGVGFSCVIESDVPVVVQHTRLDSRQAANTIMTTIAYPL